MKVEDEAQRGAQLLRLAGRPQSAEDGAQRILGVARSASAPNWLRAALRSASNMIPLTWAASWASSGLQQVAVGHKLAASLMATRVPPETLDGFGPPWRAFLVLVPSQLVVVPHAKDSTISCEIDYLSVLDDHEGPVLIARSRAREDFMLVARGSSWPILGANWSTSDEDLAEQLTTLENARDTTESHRRALSLLWRLAVGASFELAERTHVREPRSKRSGVSSRGDDLPTVQTYQLTREVVVDCRDAVGAFVGGRQSNSPSVQTLVRGHWRLHAHGPGRQERKLLHIEPYWRGPEDAPIAVRPHRLSDV